MTSCGVLIGPRSSPDQEEQLLLPHLQPRPRLGRGAPLALQLLGGAAQQLLHAVQLLLQPLPSE